MDELAYEDSQIEDSDSLTDPEAEDPADGLISISNPELVDEVKACFQDCLKKGQDSARIHQNQFRANQALVNGRQDLFYDTRNNTFVEDTQYKQNQRNSLPFVPTNLISGLSETWVALITKDDPSIYAVAPGNNISHKLAAQITNSLIEYHRDHMETSAKINEMGYLGVMGGTSAIYNQWDYKNGEPTWRVLSVEDYYIDNDFHNEDRALWYIVKDHICEEDAEALLENVHVVDYHPPTEEWLDGFREPHTSCVSYHFYYKPCTEWPQGFLAVFVGEEIVELKAYPLTFHSPENDQPEVRAPFNIFKVRYVNKSSYGRSMLTDCVPLQRYLNSTNSRKMKLVQDYTSAIRGVPPGSEGVDFFQDGEIYVDDVRKIGWVEPVPIPPALDSTAEYLRANIYDVFGISEATAGQPQGIGKSGKAIEDEANLDAMKNASAVKYLRKVILNSWITTIKQIQANTPNTKIARVVDDQNMTVLPIQYNGVSIEGVAIRLEPQSELEGRQAAKIQDAQQRLSQGLITPQKADLLGGSAESSSATQVASLKIDQFLNTGRIDIEKSDVDPEIFMSVVEQRLQEAQAARDKRTLEILLQLKAQYLTQVMAAPGVPGQSQTQSQAPGLSPPVNSELGGTAATSIFPIKGKAPNPAVNRSK